MLQEENKAAKMLSIPVFRPQGMKRPRSPSPPAPSAAGQSGAMAAAYSPYSGSAALKVKYPAAPATYATTPVKQEPYATSESVASARV